MNGDERVSLNNSRRDMTPFDMSEKPVKQNMFLMLPAWAACYALTRTKGLDRIHRDLRGVKPPFIVVAVHQGESDYYIAPRALFPYRACYVSDMEGFAAFGKGLYRQLGCIGKRRFTADISVIQNIRYALFTLKQPVVIYPESRHCDAGVTSSLPDDIGRLIKLFGVPVAVLSSHGSYLANPFWDEGHTRRTRLSASLELVYTADEVKNTSAEAIQKSICERLKYDEYEYQLNNRISITYARRAEGLHLALYKCRKCGKEDMQTKDDTLFCKSCGERWTMNEYGVLCGSEGDVHIPDWYRWERSEAEKEAQGGYDVSFDVDIRALPSERGFVPVGRGTLRHYSGGYELIAGDTSLLRDSFPLRISTRSLMSVQTEYDYRCLDRGQCIVLSTRDCCYYCYSDDPGFIVTKQEFIQEYLHRAEKISKKG